jgi:hypothetical protein
MQWILSQLARAGWFAAMATFGITMWPELHSEHGCRWVLLVR